MIADGLVSNDFAAPPCHHRNHYQHQDHHSHVASPSSITMSISFFAVFRFKYVVVFAVVLCCLFVMEIEFGHLSDSDDPLEVAYSMGAKVESGNQLSAASVECLGAASSSDLVLPVSQVVTRASRLAHTPSDQKPLLRLNKKSTWCKENRGYVTSVLSPECSESLTADTSACSSSEGGLSPPKDRKLYQQVYYRIRGPGYKAYKNFLEDRVPGSSSNLPASYTKASVEVRKEVVEYYFSKVETDETAKQLRETFMAKFFSGCLGDDADPDKKDKQSKPAQVMFNCNGDWGLITMPESLSPPRTVAALELTLKSMSSVRKLWESVRTEAIRFARYFNAKEYAVCLEVSTSTWLETGVVRLHVHLSLLSHDRFKNLTVLCRSIKFLGGKFVVTKEHSNRKRACGWSSFIMCKHRRLGTCFTQAVSCLTQIIL